MKLDNKKIVLIGTGFVGMSYAYALLNQNACDELVLIDIDIKRAEGEAMDLNHGIAFSGGNMKIYAGSYSDCHNADIIAICAGVSQKPGESRIALLQRNTEIFKSIISEVNKSGFKGIYLIATNPVDIMTHITYAISEMDYRHVIGTGTVLDTARLRFLLGDYFKINPANVHAYVMGEHGDSEFVPWSQAMIGTKSVYSICDIKEDAQRCLDDMIKISDQVKNAAQIIIEAKKSTYYGIGMSMVRITKAILNNEHSVLTVSSLMQGEYGQKDVYVGSPCIVNREGIQRTLEVNLTDDELKTFGKSCDLLRDIYKDIKIK